VVLKKSELVIDKEKTATHSVEVSTCRRIASTLLAKKRKKSCCKNYMKKIGSTSEKDE